MSPPLEKKQADGALARVASALVLAPLAIIVVLLGGWPFVLVWCLAAMIVYWEWTAEIVKAPRSAEVAGVGVLAVAGLLGGKRVRDKYRSTTPDVLASALIRLGEAPDHDRIAEGSDLR